MSREEFIKTYWRYYLILEQRVQKIEKYVEFVEDNRKTYSVEFIGCLMEIGSEIDVVMKNICGFPENDRKTIKEYAPLIHEKYGEIKEQEVRIEPDIPEKMSKLFEAVQWEAKWIEGNSDYFCRVETI